MMLINTLALSDPSVLELNRKEALRYLGVKGEDVATLSLIEDSEKELLSIASPRAVYIKTEISVKDGQIDFGFMRVNSKSLAKNLEGCDEAYVFCATLGIGLDRHYERLSKVSQARATAFSATASALVEGFCDYINEKLVKDISSRPRFSCGYGDFSIEHQKDILNVLEASKHLGVCLTASYMMVPVKTVTAVIGIRR